MAESVKGRAKAYEPDDPTELVGVRLPSPPDERAWADMAAVFIEEFALMGWPAKRIEALFRNPSFAGPHGAYRALGPDAIRALIERSFPAEGAG